MGNWQRLVWNQRDALFSGLVVTVEICIIAFACAIVGGLLLCLIRMYVRPLRPVAIVLIEFFRATPILVQLLWVNYAWPALFGWPDTFSRRRGWRSRCSRADTWRRRFAAGSKPFRAVIARLRIRSACRPRSSFGESSCRRSSLSTAPSIVNQFTVIVKSSTLVSVITVQDLMFESQRIVNVWYEPIEMLTATAVIYIIIVFLVSTAGKTLSDMLRRRYGIAAA